MIQNKDTIYAFKKYFIIAPTHCKIVQEFKEYAGIQTSIQSFVHHRAIGEKSGRLLKNAAKIIKIITEQGNLFLKRDMFNPATFAVVPENIYRDIEDRW